MNKQAEKLKAAANTVTNGATSAVSDTVSALSHSKKKNEDVVDTGNVMKGQKTGFLKKRAISPIHEALGSFMDYVDVNENYQIVYDGHSKLASLHHPGETAPIRQCRVTNTDWELFHEEVVSQMMEGIDEND